MKKAFVTGATGFLGRLLIEELSRQDWEIQFLHRPSSDLSELRHFANLVYCQGDITDYESLLHAIPTNCDAVFHLAASTNMWSRKNREQNVINIEGTRNVVEACLEKKVKKLVHTSTHSVYGLPEGRIDEQAEKKGKDSWVNYQQSKYFAEQEVLKGIEKGLDAVIMNPCSVIGPYDTKNWGRFIRMAYQQELPGIPPGGVSFGHAREVMKAHIEAVEKGKTGENYLLGGTDATFLEVAAMVEKLSGKTVPHKTTPTWLMSTMARIQNTLSYVTGKEPSITPETVAMLSRKLFSDSSKAVNELNYQIISLEEMVKDNLEWQKSEGIIK